nr:uncharacterized protein LOC127314720 [Lolium perenne]
MAQHPEVAGVFHARPSELAIIIQARVHVPTHSPPAPHPPCLILLHLGDTPALFPAPGATHTFPSIASSHRPPDLAVTITTVQNGLSPPPPGQIARKSSMNFRSIHVDELKHVLYSELKHGKMGSKHVLWIWEVSQINCY